MDIVASSSRSIDDGTAFEKMVANWEAKLAADTSPEGDIRISRRLFGQLLTTRKRLETFDVPAGNDLLKRAVSDGPRPPVVLSPDGRVARVNTIGERGFAARQGAFLDPAIIAPESLEDTQARCRAAAGQGNGAQAILQIVASDQDMRALSCRRVSDPAAGADRRAGRSAVAENRRDAADIGSVAAGLRGFCHAPLNQQTARDPDRAALIRSACEHALKQGHAVFMRELQLVRTRMDAALNAVAVLLHYLASCDDAAIDLDRIRQREARNPMVTIEPPREAAELVVYRQADLIIDRIIAAARMG